MGIIPNASELMRIQPQSRVDGEVKKTFADVSVVGSVFCSASSVAQNIRHMIVLQIDGHIHFLSYVQNGSFLGQEPKENIY